MRPSALLALALAVPSLHAQLPPQAPPAAIAAADSAATAWLAALATGGYAGSWHMASAVFRDRIREQDWVLLADGWREQFARAGQRRLVESRYLEAVPPQAPGEYVTLRYLTELTPERRVSETLLLVREADGAWRVADYLLWPNVRGDPVAWEAPVARPPDRPPSPAPPPPSTNVARPRR